jgi:hypothetical protein
MIPPGQPFRVIPCPEWGAQPPRHPISPTGKPVRAIFHHTAGHAAEISRPADESYEEAAAYARAIQHFHMGPSRGWADTGQNFLITRNGYIFEGRHGSLSACKNGRMVESAHCPGQNDQPGVEIEHDGGEAMTAIQRAAAVWLFAQLCRWGGFKASAIKGHKDCWSTSCPGLISGQLYGVLPDFRQEVAAALKPTPPPRPGYKTPPWFVDWSLWWLAGQDPATRPRSLPARIPPGAFKKLAQLVKAAKEAG